MNDQLQKIDTSFIGEPSPNSAHICLIYDCEEDRQNFVSAYLAEGLRQGEQVRYFADTTTPETFRYWLLEAGVEFPDLLEPFSLGIARAAEVYCPEGRFDPRQFIAGMLPAVERSREAGYSGLCVSGEMSWALKGLPGAERLVEYEQLLNTVEMPFRFSGLCQYDARLFDGDTLDQVLRAHPWVVVEGKIVRNPQYSGPQG